ncbi:MAG: RluA family pseudouridine synthase [Candidatus Brennerbacteria bacterium]|nr:RluA family pseudouridine synthase [Candidatus Brennerbacteria bacterium]
MDKKPTISVVYEDGNFVALSKPAGMLTHGIRNKELGIGETTVADWLLGNYPEVKIVGDNPNERPGIVHRLDKETSGILVVARNQKAFEYLKKLFQEHKIRKTYLALVRGEVKKSGVIDAPIGLKPGTVRRSLKGNLKMVKEAITEYRPLKTIEKSGETFTLLELTPKTGRTHQLRVHLASIHHPVVGDGLYGRKSNPFSLDRMFLHASSIEFTVPNGTRLKLEADLPQDLEAVIDNQF